MKKSYLLFATASALCVVLVAAGYDSSDEQREVSSAVVESLGESPILVSYAPESISLYALPSYFAPAFSANFCELVKFPELGSPALLEGFSCVARGPPKSQTAGLFAL